MSEEEKNKNKVSEPHAEYVAPKKPSGVYKNITISSFEEMREDNYRHWLSLTPEQRLTEHYSLIIRAYNYKDTYSPYDKIYFDK
jgi:hypothetical protein